MIQDSGKRETWESGSQRDSREGKGRFDLFPPRALRRLAVHFEAGAKKYGDRNWEKGQPLDRFLDSALRHIFAFMEGKRDEDHITAAAWNLLCHNETEERNGATAAAADPKAPVHECEFCGDKLPELAYKTLGKLSCRDCHNRYEP